MRKAQYAINHSRSLSMIDVKKETRSLMASTTAKREFTAEEKNACSLDAMLNGGTCEACQ
jgi:ribonucleoside-diphosphate reductase alpha chain